MIDSSGKIPNGIFGGALYSPGIVYECLDAKYPVVDTQDGSTAYQADQTSYCLVLLTSDPSLGQPSTFNFSSIFPEGTTFENALCAPRSCAKPKVNLEMALSIIVQQIGVSGVSIAVKSCRDMVDLNAPLDPYQIIIIAVLVIFTGLVLAGTLLLQAHRTRNSNDPMAKARSKAFQTITAFSVISNTESLLNTKSTSETITCLGGIRVFALFWVFFGHNYSNSFLSKIYNNPKYFVDWLKSWLYLTIYEGTAAVDTFFVMSGLLVTYVLLKEMGKNRGRFNVVYYYVHRYVA